MIKKNTDMKIFKNFIFLFLCLFSTSLVAQNLDWEKLREIQLENKEDVDQFEKHIPSIIEWLNNHSLTHSDRPNINAIFIFWLEKTSTLTVTLESYVLDYTKENPDFFLLFMTGWTIYVLENPTQKENALKCNLAGVNSILDFYKKGKDFGVKKDRKVSKLLKKRNAGKLEEFIAKKSN